MVRTWRSAPLWSSNQSERESSRPLAASRYSSRSGAGCCSGGPWGGSARTRRAARSVGGTRPWRTRPGSRPRPPAGHRGARTPGRPRGGRPPRRTCRSRRARPRPPFPPVDCRTADTPMEGQWVPPVIKRTRVVTNLWRTRESPAASCRIFLNRSQTVSIAKPVTPVTFAAVDPEKRGFSLPIPPPAPPKASSGCFVGAVAVIALLGFGLLAGTVLLAESGSGPLTAVLTTGTAWDLHWSFDCGARPGGTGRFAVDLNGPVPRSGVDERGARGHGTERAAAGAFRIAVRSHCAWNLTAVTT